MKVLVFAYKEIEKLGFDKFSQQLGFEVETVNEHLSLENVYLTKGVECIIITAHCGANKEILKKLSENGVKFVAVRSKGYDNVDLKVAKQLNIGISNANYSPNGVADFTVMLMLMVLRKAKSIINRVNIQDFSLMGNMGRNLKNLTVGVVGTGKIGETVIKNLSGFECEILGNDLCENDNIKDIINYVSLDELLKKSDIITFHTMLNESTYHLLDEKAISKMKKGAIVINLSRGEIIDTKALIKALREGNIGGAGLDVLENEIGVFLKDKRFDTLQDENLSQLIQMPNVVITPHCSFFTDQSISDMAECSLKSLYAYKNNLENEYEIKI